eukprot:403330775
MFRVLTLRQFSGQVRKFNLIKSSEKFRTIAPLEKYAKTKNQKFMADLITQNMKNEEDVEYSGGGASYNQTGIQLGSYAMQEAISQLINDESAQQQKGEESNSMKQDTEQESQPKPQKFDQIQKVNPELLKSKNLSKSQSSSQDKQKSNQFSDLQFSTLKLEKVIRNEIGSMDLSYLSYIIALINKSGRMFTQEFWDKINEKVYYLLQTEQFHVKKQESRILDLSYLSDSLSKLQQNDEKVWRAIKYHVLRMRLSSSLEQYFQELKEQQEKEKSQTEQLDNNEQDSETQQIQSLNQDQSQLMNKQRDGGIVEDILFIFKAFTRVNRFDIQLVEKFASLIEKLKLSRYNKTENILLMSEIISHYLYSDENKQLHQSKRVNNHEFDQKNSQLLFDKRDELYRQQNKLVKFRKAAKAQSKENSKSILDQLSENIQNIDKIQEEFKQQTKPEQFIEINGKKITLDNYDQSELNYLEKVINKELEANNKIYNDPEFLHRLERLEESILNTLLIRDEFYQRIFGLHFEIKREGSLTNRKHKQLSLFTFNFRDIKIFERVFLMHNLAFETFSNPQLIKKQTFTAEGFFRSLGSLGRINSLTRKLIQSPDQPVEVQLSLLGFYKAAYPEIERQLNRKMSQNNSKFSNQDINDLCFAISRLKIYNLSDHSWDYIAKTAVQYLEERKQNEKPKTIYFTENRDMMHSWQMILQDNQDKLKIFGRLSQSLIKFFVTSTEIQSLKFWDQIQYIEFVSVLSQVMVDQEKQQIIQAFEKLFYLMDKQVETVYPGAQSKNYLLALVKFFLKQQQAGSKETWHLINRKLNIESINRLWLEDLESLLTLYDKKRIEVNHQFNFNLNQKSLILLRSRFIRLYRDHKYVGIDLQIIDKKVESNEDQYTHEELKSYLDHLSDSQIIDLQRECDKSKINQDFEESDEFINNYKQQYQVDRSPNQRKKDQQNDKLTAEDLHSYICKSNQLREYLDEYSAKYMNKQYTRRDQIVLDKEFQSKEEQVDHKKKLVKIMDSLVEHEKLQFQLQNHKTLSREYINEYVQNLNHMKFKDLQYKFSIQYQHLQENLNKFMTKTQEKVTIKDTIEKLENLGIKEILLDVSSQKGNRTNQGQINEEEVVAQPNIPLSDATQENEGKQIEVTPSKLEALLVDNELEQFKDSKIIHQELTEGLPAEKKASPKRKKKVQQIKPQVQETIPKIQEPYMNANNSKLNDASPQMNDVPQQFQDVQEEQQAPIEQPVKQEEVVDKLDALTAFERERLKKQRQREEYQKSLLDSRN